MIADRPARTCRESDVGVARTNRRGNVNHPARYGRIDLCEQRRPVVCERAKVQITIIELARNGHGNERVQTAVGVEANVVRVRIRGQAVVPRVDLKGDAR